MRSKGRSQHKTLRCSTGYSRLWSHTSFPPLTNACLCKRIGEFKAEAMTVLPFESKVFLSSLLAPGCAAHPTNSASEVGLCLPSAGKKQTVCQGQPGILGILSAGPMHVDVGISSVRLLSDRIQRDSGCLGMSCSFPFLPLGKRQIALLVCLYAKKQTSR